MKKSPKIRQPFAAHDKQHSNAGLGTARATERIAINSAVFSDLAKTDNLVLASTHDLELTALLHSQYDLYHFSETIADDKLQFDYKLKKGVAQEGNAIRILELCGYPSELVQSAKNILPSIQ